MNFLWKNKLISFAYQYQKEAIPFRNMMKVFGDMIDFKKDSKILDIGSGCGRIIKLILEDIGMKAKQIEAIDISSYSLKYARKNLKKFQEKCSITFHQKDISLPDCFDDWSKNTFDLITAGFSVQYAQYWDKHKKQWTVQGYQNVLSSVFRILKPNGQFVFSVNTPNPDFSIIAKESKKVIFAIWWRIPLMLFVAIVLVLQGKILTKAANKGKFNYLPIEKIIECLNSIGFRDITYQKTYSDLAWVISCKK